MRLKLILRGTNSKGGCLQSVGHPSAAKRGIHRRQATQSANQIERVEAYIAIAAAKNFDV